MGQSITCNGYVRDSLSGEVLIVANIVLNKNMGTVSNKYGFFSIHVPAGSTRLQVSFAGYRPKNLPLNPREPFLQVLLSPTELQTPVVTPSSQKVIGLIDIPIERLKAIPMAFGKTDIMKSVALFPVLPSFSYSVKFGK
ncbi:carboxypeptidase-like regulatory domain-containing protein [Runella slithyformis]|uniref:carboxypeptidase-like regulatory domain-containing protein n=1 Tax=Runella slithyformis TaxID=106 RepID=UPI0002EFF547|nr:carboxypeptidase-like regulatory domain-containing protein [Runella slithyformis]